MQSQSHTLRHKLHSEESPAYGAPNRLPSDNVALQSGGNRTGSAKSGDAKATNSSDAPSSAVYTKISPHNDSDIDVIVDSAEDGEQELSYTSFNRSGIGCEEDDPRPDSQSTASYFPSTHSWYGYCCSFCVTTPSYYTSISAARIYCSYLYVLWNQSVRSCCKIVIDSIPSLPCFDSSCQVWDLFGRSSVSLQPLTDSSSMYDYSTLRHSHPLSPVFYLFLLPKIQYFFLCCVLVLVHVYMKSTMLEYVSGHGSPSIVEFQYFLYHQKMPRPGMPIAGNGSDDLNAGIGTREANNLYDIHRSEGLLFLLYRLVDLLFTMMFNFTQYIWLVILVYTLSNVAMVLSKKAILRSRFNQLYYRMFSLQVYN